MDAPITRVTTAAYALPTPEPQSDGTATWDKTTIVLAHVEGGGREGIGYTYASRAAAVFIAETLAPAICGLDAFDHPRARAAMKTASRNNGLTGLAMMAISAIDCALWDLRGKLLQTSLSSLLGRARGAAPLYGSGGFTSMSVDALTEQLAGWQQDGFSAVKMKVGREPGDDIARITIAARAIGSDCRLFMDANGAYTRKQALYFSQAAAGIGVAWFEEPVSSDDLEGLRLLRDRAPAGLDIAAGEYAFSSFYIRRMLEAESVDILQADATRCGGITGFLDACAAADAHGLPISSHCAPSLHVHACCSATNLAHMEWFADHARLERIFFEGASEPVSGMLRPPAGEGLGLTLRAADVERYRLI